MNYSHLTPTLIKYLSQTAELPLAFDELQNDPEKALQKQCN